MTKKNMKKTGALILLFGLFLISLSLIEAYSLPNYNGTGYGNPGNIFTINTTIVNLDSANPDKVVFTLNVSQPNGYIYKKAYYFNYLINDWVAFNLDEQVIAGTNWINSSKFNGTKQVMINATNNLRNGTNYIVTYSCEKVSGTWGNWKCGCEDASDRVCGRWMLQVFNVTGVTTTVEQQPSVCVSDADCNYASTGKKCVRGECQFVSKCNATMPCSSGYECYNEACRLIRGEGTIANPFRIYTCLDLQYMNNNLTANYVLANDIDCSATRTWNNGAGFRPIGSYNSRFAGSFDGNNYTISNLLISNQASTSGTGLFGTLSNVGIISNLGVINAVISSGGTYVGTLVGLLYGGKVVNCYSSGNVSGSTSVGGLIGAILSGGIVMNSYSSSKVSGYQMYSGGLVGASSGNISNCYSSGNVTGGYAVGGLVGRITDSSYVISNSYATGSVLGNSDSVGGLVGLFNATVINSYSIGSVSGNVLAGGLTGVNTVYKGIAVNSYWNNQTSGLSVSGVGIGKTTAQMKQQSIYRGWDFVNTWAIDSPTEEVICSDKRSGDICFLDDYSLRLSMDYDPLNGESLFSITELNSGNVICADKHSSEWCYFGDYDLRVIMTYDYDTGFVSGRLSKIGPAKNDGYPYLKGFNL
jgi:hypothetical protein